MILEWLAELWAGVLEWFLGMFPTDDAPNWAETIGSWLTDTAANAAGLGAWVPWSILGVTASIVLGTWFVLVSVKGIRWLWGLTPFSGGS